MRLRHKRQSGYTLVELLTTISVMGVLSAIAIPGTKDIVQNNRRVNLTNNMVYSMHMARSEAVKRNQQITACPSIDGGNCDNTDWSTGWIIFNDIDRDREFSVDSDETIFLHVNGSENIGITAETFTTRFTYRPNGRVMGTTTAINSGQFTFCDSRGSQEARVVIVNTSGGPKVSHKQSDGSEPSCS
jgi:type IV fimbrial biogenesis protein FimT